ELTIQKLKPREKRYLVGDGRGLYIAVMPTGEKYWYSRTFENGRERKRSLGRYPDISLKEARGLKAKGFNLERGKSLAFGVVAEEWYLKRHKPAVSEWTAYLTRKRIDKFILANFRERDIKAITPRELLPVLHKIQEKNGLVIGYYVKGILSQIFEYAIAAGYCEWNPAAQIAKALIPKRETQHYSVVKTEQQAAEIMRAINSYNGTRVVKIGLLLLAHTFVRNSEMRLARWSEIDFDKRVWIIPAERMKMRREHIVPLSEQALSLFKELREFTTHEDYCFVLRGKNKPIGESSFSKALIKLGYGKGKFTPHGFRGMASTLLNEHNFNRDVIERQLAHVENNQVRAAYNQAEYLDERRKMLDWWSAYLENLIK
ncbi:MAG: tyrosine-type recombinase/integrase, partial [Synergistaceae bacterium]|nr:tyrosine-type recombinase/integrase [Synergistaceae bacterium]